MNNRVLAIISIAYFKEGDFYKCKSLMGSLLSDPLLLKLLGQSENDICTSLESFPYFAHINVDELRFAYLLSCILTESSQPKSNGFIAFLNERSNDVFVNSLESWEDKLFSCYLSLKRADLDFAVESLKDLKYLPDSIKWNEILDKRILDSSINCFLSELIHNECDQVPISEISELFNCTIDDIKNLIKHIDA